MSRDHGQSALDGPGRADTRPMRPSRRLLLARRVLAVAIVGVVVVIPLRRHLYHLARGVAIPADEAPAFEGVAALALLEDRGAIWLDRPDDIRLFQQAAFAQKPWADPGGWRWNRLAGGTILAVDEDGEVMYEIHWTRGDEILPPAWPRGAWDWALGTAVRLAASLDPPRSFVQIRGDRRVFPIGRAWHAWLREIERQNKPMRRATVRVRDGLPKALIASSGSQQGIPVTGVVLDPTVLDGRRRATILCDREVGQQDVARLEEVLNRLCPDEGHVEEPDG